MTLMAPAIHTPYLYKDGEYPFLLDFPVRCIRAFTVARSKCGIIPILILCKIYT